MPFAALASGFFMPKNRKERPMKPRIKETLQKIIKQFENGEIPKSVAYAMFPFPDVPSSKWSLTNLTAHWCSYLELWTAEDTDSGNRQTVMWWGPAWWTLWTGLAGHCVSGCLIGGDSRGKTVSGAERAGFWGRWKEKAGWRMTWHLLNSVLKQSVS